jgi:triacylglycerol lipase
MIERLARAATVCMALVLCLSWTNRSLADGPDGNQSPPEPPQGFYPRGPACGPNTSPFKVPEASGKQFVVNCGAGLDTGCTFRPGSPLTIQLPVTRYLGPTNADGTLLNATEAVQSGMLPKFAILRLPVYDIDYVGFPNFPECGVERDRVLFNGLRVETLDPSNAPFLNGRGREWVLNTYRIPIQLVKFPAQRGAPGSAPVPAINEIKIEIDTAGSQTENCWCMAVDWVALQVENFSPIVFVPGNSLDGVFFYRQGFFRGVSIYPPIDPFGDNHGNQWDYFLKLGRVPTPQEPSPPNQVDIEVNSSRIKDQLWPILRSFGATSCHLVQHSKGGLDARDYLAKYYPKDSQNFKVLSYTSVGTPHDGSFLADLMVAKEKVTDVEIRGLPLGTELLARLKSSNGGYPDLRVPSCAAFNASNVPALRALQRQKKRCVQIWTRISIYKSMTVSGSRLEPKNQL